MSARSTGWGAYHEIARTLREAIERGDWPPGMTVPSEKVLAERFGVVRNTVRRALAELEHEGLVVKIPGIKRVIPRPDTEVTVPRLAHQRIAAELRAQINNGDLPALAQLPSEITLADRHGVARDTVRRALARLEADGLITTVHGRGRFVTDISGTP